MAPALLWGCSGSGGDNADASTDGPVIHADVVVPHDGHSDDAKHKPDGPPPGYVKLTVIVPTEEGSVLSSDHQIYCGFGGSCEGYYPEDTAVTLTEVRQIDYLFTGWGGGCQAAGSSTTCVVTLVGETTVSVSYEVPPLVTLKVSVSGGSGNMVTSNPTGISTGGTQTASFPQGTGMTLSAVPGTDQTFQKWVGGQCGSGTMATMSTCMFGLGGNDVEMATFMEASYYP